MCGIVGLFSFKGPAPFRGHWPRMINHLAHRGPDGGGFWAEGPFFLGHRRLSILDIAGGSQPMTDGDGSLVVVYNGEIYNYLELRRELTDLGARFRTASDTEVLLHGYRAWGTDLPRRLTGMFAFALADRRKQTLFLARDRFGEKPLLWRRKGDYLAFASELKALCALPDLDRRMDPDALAGFLTHNYVPGDSTLMAGVKRLAPGSWALYGVDGGRREGVFWRPPAAVGESPPQSLPEAVEVFREKLDGAVRIALRSDVPVGIFLSGGVDSPLTAESAVRQGRLHQAYVVDFEEQTYSEYAGARRVAERLGLPLKRVVLTAAVLEEFFDLVGHADDPLADASMLPVWAVSRRAARDDKVVLGGDGGDELFGGYLTYRATLLHQRYTAALPRPFRRAAAGLGRRLPTSEGKVTRSYKLRRFLRAADLPPGQAHFTWNGGWLPAEAAGLLTPGPARRAAGAVLAGRFGDQGRVSILDLQRADLENYLPNDILVKTDRLSMAFGLETRAPLLNHDLAKWALSLPESLKIGPRGELKRVLRAAAREIYGPGIADQPKQGFSPPIHAWVRGVMAETMHDLLAPSSVKRLGFLDAEAVGAAWRDHLAGRRSYGFELFTLAVLVAWHRLRIERPPAAPPDLPLVELRL
jgi:asparagine synthase (glutamine-hydrolysing)